MIVFCSNQLIKPPNMKPTLLFVLSLWLPLALFADVAPTPRPGLVRVEYPRHKSQANDKDHFQVALEQLGEPTGQKVVIKSLSPWTWNPERNAVARGWLRIDADGDYQFTSNSFYDRNLLIIDDKTVCPCRDGEEAVATIALKKGMVKILSAGFVGGRGASGITVRWKPPGQAELSEIPESHLQHDFDPTVTYVSETIEPSKATTKSVKRTPPRGRLLATHLVTVADDFVVEAYKNGVRLPGDQRKLLDEIHGATVERMAVEVRPGDWLVFHVVNNQRRWGGVKYFAVAGCLGDNEFGFVSDPGSDAWSVCDDPAQVRDFIRQREAGTDVRPGAIAKPWREGDDHMRRHAGSGFPGKPLWGGGASTWIKFVAPKDLAKPVTLPSKDVVPGVEVRSSPAVSIPKLPPAPNASLTPTRWPVQILYAMFGSGDRNADVTLRVKEFVETKKTLFAVDPTTLGVDPIPYWQKSLWIAYVKDGVRREVRRYENEHVLPESFYGPQDAAELAKWLPNSRWKSDQGELQFYADHTVVGYPFEGTPKWEALAGNRVRISWSDERKLEYLFDFTWSSFHNADDPKAVFKVVN